MFYLSTMHILPLDPAQIRHCLLKGVKVGHPILAMKLPTVADRTPRVDLLSAISISTTRCNLDSANSGV